MRTDVRKTGLCLTDLASVVWIVVLFDRGIEGTHVDVKTAGGGRQNNKLIGTYDKKKFRYHNR